MRRCRPCRMKGGNSAFKEPRLRLGFCAPPTLGLWRTVCQNDKQLAFAPETTKTTLCSGSFGSGVDEERS